MGLIIGVDASRNRSGGAQAHLIGILDSFDPYKQEISEIHVWSYQSLLDSVPDKPWLIKHSSRELQKSLITQMWWQLTKLTKELKFSGCDILFTTAASSLCRFEPSVVLSQDMLSYEPGAMRYFGYGKMRLRLFLILILQNRAFRRADSVIFLTKYAGDIIQKVCGKLPKVKIIPHGIDEQFRSTERVREWPKNEGQTIRCIYISNAELYKHQWVVVSAFEELINRGHNVDITFVGGGTSKALRLLKNQISISDPNQNFVRTLDFIPQSKLPNLLADADLFVFASSCENLPVTLLEAMASRLPIACSNRGPMPEILRDAGIYFDPENSAEIADAIELIIRDEKTRSRIVNKAEELSLEYTWPRCADETWSFVANTYNDVRNSPIAAQRKS